MKPLSWLAGILLYLAFIAAMAPASTLLWLAGRLASSAITASATSGTLWRGAAGNISFTPPGGQIIRLEHLAWNVHPLALALGHLPVEIEFDDAAARGRGSLHLSASGLEITRLDASLPAAWLARIQPRLDAFQPAGTLILHTDQFSLYRNHYRGQGEILWQDATLGLSPVRPLGGYQCAVSGNGENIQFQLHTRSGPLELAGSGTWSRQSGIHFSGTARARERASELTPALALLGRPDSSGSYTLNF